VIEAMVEKTVCNQAEMTGWYVRKVEWPGRRGAPDRLFARAGELFFVEFKRPGARPEPHQDREHGRMRAAGIAVHVVDNVPAGLKLLGILK
jgi:hypothetical protein